MDLLINNYHFRLNDFYSGCSLFHACQIFNSKFIHSGDISRKDIRRYSIITELNNPSDDLLDEWAIYCGTTIDVNLMESTLDEY